MSEDEPEKSGAWSPGPGCHGGCGIEIYKENGKLKKIEGDKEHPYKSGNLCSPALALKQYVNHPDRLKYPLKRVGEKGENEWKRIDWEEAFDTIEEKFREIKEKYGPESIIFGQGTGRDIGGPISLLAYSYGSPNWTQIGFSGHSCYTPRLVGMYSTFGDYAKSDAGQFFPERYESEKFELPETIVVWGRNLKKCHDHFNDGNWIIECMKRGSKVIDIDPMYTWLADKSDLWLQVRPGTDGALALAMLNVIINEELYDEEFVEEWCYGFEELKERVQKYTPEWAEEKSWIPAEKIEKAARMYANSDPATIEHGNPIDTDPEATTVMQAISQLWSITGNLDVPGGEVIARMPFGVAIYPYSTEEIIQVYGEELFERLKEKKVGGNEYPVVRDFRGWIQPDKMFEQMETGDPYPIKGLWIQGSNPVGGQAQEPERLMELARDLFVVVVDLFMTPTVVSLADIVLPASALTEKNSVFNIGVPLNAIKKEFQVGECKSDWEINLELAKRFNPELDYENPKEMFSDRLEPAEMDFDELCEKVWAMSPENHPSGSTPYYRYEKGLLREDGEPGFKTETGKVELKSKFFEDRGLDPLPYYEEPLEGYDRTPDLAEEYPLILVSGRRKPYFFHSEHRQIPWLREQEPHPVVEIHPETARKRGIKDGDWVWLKNDRGKCKRKAELTFKTHPKMIHTLHAWWYPEEEASEPTLYRAPELNINNLVPTGYNSKSGFGGAPYRYILCDVSKGEE